MYTDKIKNIIFDVGSVLIGYRWFDMCMDKGIPQDKALRIGKAFFQSLLWADYDAGLVSTKELTEAVVKEEPELEEEIRWFIGNAQLMLVKRPEVWELVRQLKEKGYHIYLLSNYSEDLFTIHTTGLDFLKWIDGGVISYQIHEIKPYPPIYQHLLKKYDLKAEECLFFDDREENTEAARKLGFEAVTVIEGSEELLKEELKKLL